MNRQEKNNSKQPSGKGSSLKDELRKVFAKAKLPSNPAIAAQILELVNDRNSSAEQFGEVIQADASLSARLLEMSNAARFAQRMPATTIHRAVTILGLRRIRMVALGFQLVSHLDRLGNCPFDLKAHWRQSVLRGCLAREVARLVVPEHVEEAFLIGLLQDCGVLTLVQVLGSEYADCYANEDLSPTAFHLQEKKRFPHTHVDAISVMADEWNLPEMIAEPLRRHHQRIDIGANASDYNKLCAVSFFMGSMCLGGEHTLCKSEPQLKIYAQHHLGLSNEDLEKCFANAADSYKDMAALLREQLPTDLDVTDLLERANGLLSRVASETDLHLTEVEAEREQIQRQQTHLKHALGQYRERAERDPLTGLLNRAALLDAANACTQQGALNDVSLAVFFLDLDNFKLLNDQFGHSCGDDVLRAVADTIGGCLGQHGLGGRFGGEEFVIVFPDLESKQATTKAKELNDKIRNLDFARLGVDKPITCSLGAVWTESCNIATLQELISAADELMYQAKRGGKDHSCFKAMGKDNKGEVIRLGAPYKAEIVGRINKQTTNPKATSETHNKLRRIAEEMNNTQTNRVVSARKQERTGVLAPCKISCFSEDGSELCCAQACVRNISPGGIGVVSVIPLVRGEPIEVSVTKIIDGPSSLHVAGLVAFCRHAEQGIYEIGIQIVNQGNTPLFDAKNLKSTLAISWVAKALKLDEKDANQDLKESA
ncbi:MAG: HDOD domain-containing protein [Planctomycetes bacterium]|nr:HDOD domain-containing protein [Planctomycetota bacterium]